MRIPSHLEKFRRLSALRGRLDSLEDFELWYWTTLTAGTNALNAVFHDAGMTSDDPVFSTIPGVHLVRHDDGTYQRELRGPGDVSHVNWPVVDGAGDPDVEALVAAMVALETWRDACVRSDLAPTPAIANECDAAFRQVESILRQRFPGELA
ncbi:hypothetical protein [Paraburkholderia sediminicola]|uniref:hypothetical protein n=1 Tax=Paraburkholderia sediminicola TaxID=458836 RepID=UPI000EAD355C